MSKKTNKNKKEIALGTTKARNLDGKTFFIKNTASFYFLDCNNIGNVYFVEKKPNDPSPNKWEFIKTESVGTYYIKHVNTQLYLTSDEHGDIFTTIPLNSTLQKWNIYSTSVAETYNVQNMSNELYLLESKTDDVYLYMIDDDKKKDFAFFHIFQRFPKK